MDGFISYLSPLSFRKWVSNFVVEFKSPEDMVKLYRSLVSSLRRPVRSSVRRRSAVAVFEMMHSSLRTPDLGSWLALALFYSLPALKTTSPTKMSPPRPLHLDPFILRDVLVQSTRISRYHSHVLNLAIIGSQS